MAYVGKIRAKDINTGKWLTLYKQYEATPYGV